MLQNYQPRRNFKSFRPWRRFRRPEKPAMAATAANWTTVRLSSGICTNILDFGIPQKHVLGGVLAMETGCEAGVAEVRTNQASRPGKTGRRQKSRRFGQAGSKGGKQ